MLTLTRTLAAGTVAIVAVLVSSPGASDPFALATPAGFLDQTTRARVDEGAAVVEVLSARDCNLAIVGAVRTHVQSDRLVTWTRRIEQLQKGPFMPSAGRFSQPPQVEDVESLVLSESDLDDIRGCRPGDCGLKLSTAEIEQFRRTISTNGAEWRSAVQGQFRQIMVERARRYLQDGYDSTAPYSDHRVPVPPGLEFRTVAALTREGGLHEPRLMDYLENFPRADGADIESFLYWSTEVLGGGKPIVSITQVAIVRGMNPAYPEALVASKQIFATHYLSASLSLTAITPPSAHGHRYLLYTRHSRVDLFRGTLAGMVRRMVEKRIRSDGPAVLDGLRRRLETGEPAVVPESPGRDTRGRP